MRLIHNLKLRLLAMRLAFYVVCGAIAFAIGWTTGPVTDADVRALKWLVIAAVALMTLDAARKAWRWFHNRKD